MVTPQTSFSPENTTPRYNKNHVISSLYVCMVNVKLKYNIVKTPRSLSVLIITALMISTDEDPSLRIKSFAIINFVVVEQNYILIRIVLRLGYLLRLSQ